ncbi:hypothetical protein WBP07_22015 (plasmid) [Novosphingobium sp. BL-8A]|uniref:hypothetical protein n=1 Tax=Novosphingobium sp. BL-8A TaxID=3127639 RepID=UPI0037569814
MRAILSAVLLAAAVAGPVAAHAETPPAAAKTKAAYKVQDTDLGTMLDDPAAKAILLKYIPEIVNNPQIEMGRGMTLAQLQQFAGDQLTDEKLAKIQADLDAARPN